MAGPRPQAPPRSAAPRRSFGGARLRQLVERKPSLLIKPEVYESPAVKDFPPNGPIDLTALVELDSDGTRSVYFIGPRNGGLEIEFGRNEVTVITPQSPLGQNLMGKKAGQRWTTKFGGANVKYHIVSVH